MSATPCCNKVYRMSMLSGSWFHIRKCNDCGKLWCHKCGKYGDRCPKCESKSSSQHSTYNMPR